MSGGHDDVHINNCFAHAPSLASFAWRANFRTVRSIPVEVYRDQDMALSNLLQFPYKIVWDSSIQFSIHSMKFHSSTTFLLLTFMTPYLEPSTPLFPRMYGIIKTSFRQLTSLAIWSSAWSSAEDLAAWRLLPPPALLSIPTPSPASRHPTRTTCHRTKHNKHMRYIHRTLQWYRKLYYITTKLSPKYSVFYTWLICQVVRNFFLMQMLQIGIVILICNSYLIIWYQVDNYRLQI